MYSIQLMVREPQGEAESSSTRGVEWLEERSRGKVEADEKVKLLPSVSGPTVIDGTSSLHIPRRVLSGLLTIHYRLRSLPLCHASLTGKLSSGLTTRLGFHRLGA
jgi:hypothetical protein